MSLTRSVLRSILGNILSIHDLSLLSRVAIIPIRYHIESNTDTYIDITAYNKNVSIMRCSGHINRDNILSFNPFNTYHRNMAGITDINEDIEGVTIAIIDEGDNRKIRYESYNNEDIKIVYIFTRINDNLYIGEELEMTMIDEDYDYGDIIQWNSNPIAITRYVYRINDNIINAEVRDSSISIAMKQSSRVGRIHAKNGTILEEYNATDDMRLVLEHLLKI